jgi:hypothetical protein
MNPQLIIVQQHQAKLRAEASHERLARGARSMRGSATGRFLVVTRIAATVRSLAGRQTRIARLTDTTTL